MKFKPTLQQGRLIKRYKRFLADIELPDGELITIHCPNTGSMKNCNEPGSRVWFSTSDNPKRKYPNTWEMVEVAKRYRAGINTGRANALVEEAIRDGIVSELQGYDEIQREVKYGEENSRIDLLLRAGKSLCYVEIKNVTLWMGDGVGIFPDAVTTRGQKHLRELMAMKAQGHRAVIFFCIQHTGIETVAPADEIDPDYGAMLREAHAAGVEVLAYGGDLTARAITLNKPIPVLL